MSRAADYTIQGFLYQFNKTVLEILKANEDEATNVEGIIEDIEVVSSSSIKLIQCKYHEAKTSFTPSTVYKPLLQMLKHFSDNTSANIQYVLFAHFPGVCTTPPTVDKSTLQAALGSDDTQLKKHIDAVPNDINLDGFIDRFEMEFGVSYAEITEEVAKELKANEIPDGDIETLAYPNAIHMVAMLSIKHDPAQRNITKKQFLLNLKAIRTTAISRWTLALSTRKKLLETRRKQLKVHLDKNVRLRYFLVDPTDIADYDSEIVLFISDFIDKYNSKIAHSETPILCLCANLEDVQSIQRRLYAKEIITEDGYIGGEFHEPHFFRDPLFLKKQGGKIQWEFALRLLSWEDNGIVLNNRKCDDIFIIGEPNCESLDTVDVNVEHLAGATMQEIKYVMGVSNVYE